MTTCSGIFPLMRRFTIKRARTWYYIKICPCIEQSNDLAPLPPFRLAGRTAPSIRPDMIFGKDNYEKPGFFPPPGLYLSAP